MPIPQGAVRSRWSSFPSGWRLAGAGLFFLLSTVHSFFLLFYSTDVPIGDGWEIFNADQLPSGFRWEWVFSTHNEHRIVPSRLTFWLIYKLFDFNLHYLFALNFLLYAGFVGSFFYLRQLRFGQVSLTATFFFGIFLVSTRASENLLWAFQNSFHFFVLFSLWGAYWLFHRKQSFVAIAVGVALLGSTVFTLAGGVPLTLGVLAVWVPFKGLRILKAPDRKGREALQTVLGVGCLVALCAYWLSMFHPHPGHPALVYPNRLVFWEFWLSCASSGLGFQTSSLLLGALCLAILLYPLLCLGGGEKWEVLSSEVTDRFFLLGLIAGVMAFFASISMGRAGQWPHLSGASRYSEVGMLLMFSLFYGWARWAEKKNARQRKQVLCALWFFCLIGYFNDWNFSQYRSSHRHRMAGLECVRKAYLGEGEDLCPAVYPFKLGQKLKNAKDLKASFYQKLFPQEERNH